MEIESLKLPKTKEELRKLIEAIIEEKNQAAEAERTELQKVITEQHKQLTQLQADNQWLKEIIAARNRRLFGRKSEKLSAEELQYWLFNEIELQGQALSTTTNEPQGNEIKVRAHARKNGGRKALPADLPRERVLHEVAAAEKTCSCCGAARPLLGEDTSEELALIPMKVYVKLHVYPKYGPCKCKATKGKKELTLISQAPWKKKLIPGSIADESFLAYLAVSKFEDALPFYRQEKILKRYGLDYDRATMCQQMIKISGALQGLIELMWEEARSGPVLHMDETTLQVLHEPGRATHTKSWMWVMVGRPCGKKVIIFHYHQSRGGEVARSMIKGFKGYLQSDGYSAYNTINKEHPVKEEQIIQVGCWAHVRRRFIEAKGNKDYSSQADTALEKIALLFHLDNKLRKVDLNENDFVAKRKEQSLPVLDELFIWLKALAPQVAPKTYLGEALNYTIKEWPKLIRYLEHAYLTPDNNEAENSLRPFVIGRKNWLFANTPLGAYASSTLYSFIESAKANQLEPLDYLSFLFVKLPITPKEKLKELLPHLIDAAIVKDFSKKQP